MRIVSVTPAGRRRYMEILAQHLLRQRHIIDKHFWWLNTDVPEDIAFLRSNCAEHPDFFQLCEKPFDADKTHGANIWKFFRNFADPDTLYLRFDDDIVWMADDAVETLVRFRCGHPDAPLVLGNIVNNAICSAAHQQAGLISTVHGTVLPICEDWVGWRSARFARLAHESLLADIEAGRSSRWTNLQIPLDCGQRFSINVISWLGKSLATLPELMVDELGEEPFLTQTLPPRIGHANLVCSDALFAHFAFYPQRPYMDWTSNDLLERYQALAEQRAPRPELINTYWRADATWRISKPFRKLRRSVMKRLGKTVG
jgi:hypothetical protein